MLAKHRPISFMIKIKKDSTNIIVDCDNEELVFAKADPIETLRLLEYIIFVLGLKDTYQVHKKK